MTQILLVMILLINFASFMTLKAILKEASR